MAERPARRRPRFPWFGRPQLWVTLSLLAVVIGTMLPWFTTFLGNRFGIDGWGIVATWGACVGLVGAFSIRERWYRLLPVVGSLVALGIILWVAVDAAQVCRPASDGTAPCRPSVGFIVSGAGALNAVLWSFRARRWPLPSAPAQRT